MVYIKRKGTEAQPQHTRASSKCDPRPVASPSSTKKRRAPNAFILFRSIMIAKGLVPPELTHQNDVSCYVAKKWRNMSASDRSHFFKMAEEHRKRLETGPAPSTATKTEGPHRYAIQETANLAPTSPYTFLAEAHVHPAPDLSNTARPALNAGYSGAPAAPQPVRAIPTELLHWGHDDPSDLPLPNMQEMPGSDSLFAVAFWPAEYSLEVGMPELGSHHAQTNFASTPYSSAFWQQYSGPDDFYPLVNACLTNPHLVAF